MAHNPEVVGSSPASATIKVPKLSWFRNFLYIQVSGALQKVAPRTWRHPDGNLRFYMDFADSGTWNSLDSDRIFANCLFVPGAKVDGSITL